MKYPKFLSKGDTIGICPLSAGLGKKIDELEESLAVFKREGYQVIETASTRSKGARAASASKRAKELDQLVCDKKVNFISLATGGDYQFETVPLINYEHILENPKWIMGYSDPTNLLYPVTTKLDIATIYGNDACGFELKTIKDEQANLDIIKGNLVKQNSYKNYCDALDKYQGHPNFEKKVKWISKKDVDVSGRCIGGCFDVIEKLIGTPYDGTLQFIERYKEDGTVFYFDVFSISAYNFYLSLLQMKYAGYFKYCKAILIGRVAIPTIEDKKFDYIKAADKALGNIPHIMEMDIGHSNPRMTMINGAMIHVQCKDNKGSIQFKLK